MQNENTKPLFDSSKKVQSVQLPIFKLDVITKELFNEIAENWARILSDEGQKNKSTQIRRFYDELVLWCDRVDGNPEEYKRAEPFIYMMRSKVAYAEGRKTVSENFKRFMNNLIREIHDAQTLKNAKLFMEAVVGFYKEK